MIHRSHGDSLILPWIRKQIIQTHETHIRHCHSYLKIRRKKLFLDFFLNKTSEDIQCSLRWFHRNLLGWPLWSPSISSIESVKVSAAEVEDRGTVDGALARGWSSSESQPAPVGGGQSRWTFAEKLFFCEIRGVYPEILILDFSNKLYGDFEKYNLYQNLIRN